MLNASDPPVKCLDLDVFDAYTPGLEPGPWTYQRCTEFLMAFSVAEDSRMFLPCGSRGMRFHRNCWDPEKFSDFCNNRLGVRPADSNAQQAYWGAGEAGWRKQPRLILSNGRLDPWGYGGVSFDSEHSPEGGAALFWINESAHHLDLRSPDELDPTAVTEAREAELRTIQAWLHDHHAADVTAS